MRHDYRGQRMTLRLTVHRAAWMAHVRDVADAYGPGLVPVVKGNGYGFGRPALHEVAGTIGRRVGVGTVHELGDVPQGIEAVVLTPTLHPPEGHPDAVLTVGSIDHVRALAGWRGRVTVKLASSMRRYGTTPADLPALLGAVADAGLEVDSFSLHLPLAGEDHDRLAEVEQWLHHLTQWPELPLSVSQLAPESFHSLREKNPGRELRVRVGTALWLGRPRGGFFHLGADVVQARPVSAGEPVGYRRTPAPQDGTLLCIGTGSTHGVRLLDHIDPQRRSPFHFARQRLALLEPPHMHTTMCIVPTGQPCPEPGEIVDVQQPFTGVIPDELEWRP